MKSEHRLKAMKLTKLDRLQLSPASPRSQGRLLGNFSAPYGLKAAMFSYPFLTVNIFKLPLSIFSKVLKLSFSFPMQLELPQLDFYNTRYSHFPNMHHFENLR